MASPPPSFGVVVLKAALVFEQTNVGFREFSFISRGDCCHHGEESLRFLLSGKHTVIQVACENPSPYRCAQSLYCFRHTYHNAHRLGLSRQREATLKSGFVHQSLRRWLMNLKTVTESSDSCAAMYEPHGFRGCAFDKII